MRKRLFSLYWWLERRIHPGLRYSQYNYRDVLDERVAPKCDWLDLGCGHQMFAPWMKNEERDLAARSRRFIGIDRDMEGLRANAVIHHAVFGDAGALPFKSEDFDLVTANMVIEHVEDPAAVLGSVQRVLRPGGLFIFHTPNRNCVVMTMARVVPQFLKNWLALVLEGREEKDVFPTHYAMNDAESISRYAGSCGFVVKEIRSVSTSAMTALMPPLCVIELIYLRILERPAFAGLRSNLIVTLERT
jgi:ubiquinone/menaquinone biosynthesis C-methylase UbiE